MCVYAVNEYVCRIYKPLAGMGLDRRVAREQGRAIMYGGIARALLLLNELVGVRYSINFFILPRLWNHRFEAVVSSWLFKTSN